MRITRLSESCIDAQTPQIGCGHFLEDVVRLRRRKREARPSPDYHRHCCGGILHRHIAGFMASRYFPDVSVPFYFFSVTVTFKTDLFKCVMFQRGCLVRGLKR